MNFIGVVWTKISIDLCQPAEHSLLNLYQPLDTSISDFMTVLTINPLCNTSACQAACQALSVTTHSLITNILVPQSEAPPQDAPN
jgi:hypothetical protein